MSRFRPTNGLFLIVALAAFGFLLVYIPPKVLEQYDRVKALGPPWTYFYFALVGTGGLILLTLSIAIVISLVISLSATPMMCSRLLPPHRQQTPGRIYRASEAVFQGILHAYGRTLGWALAHGRLVMLVLFATIALNIVLFTTIPKGLFPQADTGRLSGIIQADQSISFQLMREKLTQIVDILRQDPAVAHLAAFTGGRRTNGGFGQPQDANPAAPVITIELDLTGEGEGEECAAENVAAAQVRPWHWLASRVALTKSGCPDSVSQAR